MDKNENPAVTRSDLFDVLDDFTGASSQSIEQLKGLLDLTVFSAAWGATTTPILSARLYRPFGPDDPRLEDD